MFQNSDIGYSNDWGRLLVQNSSCYAIRVSTRLRLPKRSAAVRDLPFRDRQRKLRNTDHEMESRVAVTKCND